MGRSRAESRPGVPLWGAAGLAWAMLAAVSLGGCEVVRQPSAVMPAGRVATLAWAVKPGEERFVGPEALVVSEKTREVFLLEKAPTYPAPSEGARIKLRLIPRGRGLEAELDLSEDRGSFWIPQELGNPERLGYIRVSQLRAGAAEASPEAAQAAPSASPVR